MPPEGTQEYCRRMRALKEQYAGRLQVYLGVEQDICSDAYACIEDYYNAVARLYEQTGCQIVGHFDLMWS